MGRQVGAGYSCASDISERFSSPSSARVQENVIAAVIEERDNLLLVSAEIIKFRAFCREVLEVATGIKEDLYVPAVECQTDELLAAARLGLKEIQAHCPKDVHHSLERTMVRCSTTQNLINDSPKDVHHNLEKTMVRCSTTQNLINESPKNVHINLERTMVSCSTQNSINDSPKDAHHILERSSRSPSVAAELSPKSLMCSKSAPTLPLPVPASMLPAPALAPNLAPWPANAAGLNASQRRCQGPFPRPPVNRSRPPCCPVEAKGSIKRKGAQGMPPIPVPARAAEAVQSPEAQPVLCKVNVLGSTTARFQRSSSLSLASPEWRTPRPLPCRTAVLQPRESNTPAAECRTSSVPRGRARSLEPRCTMETTHRSLTPRNRGVSVRRRYYRQSWVLDHEDHFVVGADGPGSNESWRHCV